MKIFLTAQEVIDVSRDCLDINEPNPDKVHEIAERLGMVYDEYLDMYEDLGWLYLYVQEWNAKRYAK